MNQNIIVLEISSDEDEIWTEDNPAGISGDGDDDHKWLTELLNEVNQKKYVGGDEVTVVNKSERSGKKLKLNLKSSVVELDDDDDDDDECVMLENDPNESVNVSNDNQSNGGGDDDDDTDEIVVVSEKGQVACRDYPHSRHLCIKFPFSTTPNQSHCEQCYCYVCDSLAPCIYWGNGSTTTDHCHATDKDELWRHMRKTIKTSTNLVQPVHKVADSVLLNRLHPVHRHRPASTPEVGRVQPRNHTLANFGTPNITGKKRNNLLSSKYRFHPDLVSHYRKTNVARTNTSYSLRTQIQRPVLKKNRLASVCRSRFANPGRQQDHYPNGILSGGNTSNNYIRPPLQPTSINVSNNLDHNFQSQVANPGRQQDHHPNGILSGGNTSNNYIRPPLPPTAVNVSNNLNRTFQSQVNSNPFYQQPYLAQPLPPRSQVASSQWISVVPAKQSYPVHSHNPLHPVPDFLPNFSNRTQPQIPETNPEFKEKTINSASAQSSVTNEATDGLSLLDAVPDELTNYDWIFDSQPVEQGFTDEVYGANDFSSDSSSIDTGPIFDF